MCYYHSSFCCFIKKEAVKFEQLVRSCHSMAHNLEESGVTHTLKMSKTDCEFIDLQLMLVFQITTEMSLLNTQDYI